MYGNMHFYKLKSYCLMIAVFIDEFVKFVKTMNFVSRQLFKRSCFTVPVKRQNFDAFQSKNDPFCFDLIRHCKYFFIFNSGCAFSSIKLTYFNALFRAEAARCMLKMNDVKFDDVRLEPPEWEIAKRSELNHTDFNMTYP